LVVYFRYINKQINDGATPLTRMNLHRDRHNKGDSLIIEIMGGPDCSGGGLWVAGLGKLEIREWTKFDGNIPHGPLPSTGERYSIVLYTNSNMKTASRDDLEVPCRLGLCTARLFPFAIPAIMRNVSECSVVDILLCSQQARQLGFRLPEPSELAARDAQTESRRQFPSLWDATKWSDFTELGGRLPPPPQGKSDNEYSTDQVDSEDDGESEDEENFVFTTATVSPDVVLPLIVELAVAQSLGLAQFP